MQTTIDFEQAVTMPNGEILIVTGSFDAVKLPGHDWDVVSTKFYMDAEDRDGETISLCLPLGHPAVQQILNDSDRRVFEALSMADWN